LNGTLPALVKASGGKKLVAAFSPIRSIWSFAMKNLILGLVTAAVLLTGSLFTNEANAQYGRRFYSYRPYYGYRGGYYSPRYYGYRPYSYGYYPRYYYGSPRVYTGYRGYYPYSYGYGSPYGYRGGVYFNF
jgi:hypothetical protein